MEERLGMLHFWLQEVRITRSNGLRRHYLETQQVPIKEFKWTVKVSCMKWLILLGERSKNLWDVIYSRGIVLINIGTFFCFPKNKNRTSSISLICD